MFRNFLTICLIFSFTSCAKNWYKPMGQLLFNNMPRGGSPGFELGWIHGCQSGMGSGFGSSVFMSFYSWSRDPDITSVNPDISKIRMRYKTELKNIDWNNEAEVKKNFSDYNTIFWGAHAFCRHSLLGMHQMAGIDVPLPGGDRYVPGADNLGSVWRLNGRGDVRIGSPMGGGFW
jgi:hypothetical protein